MVKIFPLLFFVGMLASVHTGWAQYNGEFPDLNADTVVPRINWTSEKENKKKFPVQSFIVPSAMVALGVASINNKNLWSVNEKAKEEIYTERGSYQKTQVDNYLIFGPIVAVYGLNAMGIKGKNNFRDRTILLGLSEMIMASSVFAVKNFSGETRPDGSDQYSFPSGHTAAAFAAAEFMRQEYKDVSPWYAYGGYAMAAATGYLRMYNNKHWMGDVVAGAGIGMMSTRLAYWIYPLIKGKIFRDKEIKTIVMPTYQSGSFGFGLVHKF